MQNAKLKTALYMHLECFLCLEISSVIYPFTLSSYISYICIIYSCFQVGVEILERSLDIGDFTAIQNRLQVLESQPNGRAFCKTLESLMRGYGFAFSVRGNSKRP